MMKNIFNLLLVILLVGSFSGVGFADENENEHEEESETELLYGPESFEREKGRPFKQQAFFNVENPSGLYQLKITNGKAKKNREKHRSEKSKKYEEKHQYHKSKNKSRVRSAKIWLNGELIVKPSDFSKNINEITKNVVLLSENRLEVKIKGKPNSYLTITICCDEETENKAIVPNLIGLYIDEAIGKLHNAGLRLGEIQYEQKLLSSTNHVIYQSLPFSKAVSIGEPINITLVSFPPPEQTVFPINWSGVWEIKSQVFNLDSGGITSSETITNTICGGDPLGVSLANSVLQSISDTATLSCTSSISENRLQSNCLSQLFYNKTPTETCETTATTELIINLESQKLMGNGTFSISNTCLTNQELTIKVQGKRLGPDLSGLCKIAPSSFFQKFLHFPVSLDI